MGPQNSQGGRRRPRFGATALTVAGVAIAALGGSALAPHPHAGVRLTAGADNASLTDTGNVEFDGRSSAIQVAGFTVINQGKTAIPISGVVTAITNAKPNPFAKIADGCTGTSIPPAGYCVVSLEFTAVPGRLESDGNITVTAGDGSTIQAEVTASDGSFNSVAPDPTQLDFGSLNVGTTSAAKQITLHAAPSGRDFEPIEIQALDIPGKPKAGADYHVMPGSDTCSGTEMFISFEGPSQDTCQIGETAAPSAAGSRPAFLDVAYCDPESFDTIDPTGDGTRQSVPPPLAPPGVALVCGHGDGFSIYAFHLLVSMTATGIPPTTATNPLTPVLTASPPLATAGRTTLLTGTGFPNNTTVTLGLVPAGTPTTASLAGVPGAMTVATNGIGGFANQVMLIMPHTAPGQYEILAQAPGGAAAIAAFLVAPGNQEPPKFVTRH